MRDVNSRLKVSHKKMSYHKSLWINNNLFCKYRWSVLNIYFFNSRYFTIVRHSSHNRSRLPILVYGVIFLRGSLLFLYHMKKNDPWVIWKKKFYFSTAWMSLFFAWKWPRSSSYGDRYSILHCLCGGITNGSPINI